MEHKLGGTRERGLELQVAHLDASQLPDSAFHLSSPRVRIHRAEVALYRRCRLQSRVLAHNAPELYSAAANGNACRAQRAW